MLFLMFHLMIKTKQNFRKHLSLVYVNTQEPDNCLEILLCEQLSQCPQAMSCLHLMDLFIERPVVLYLPKFDFGLCELVISED